MKTAIKERPILFSGDSIRAILDGKKTVTRRVVKPQPDIVYRLCDDIISVDGTFPLSVKGVVYEAFDSEIWRYVNGDSGLAERRLYGGQRWSNIFTDEICRIWQEGYRGLVPASWSHNQERISIDFFVPQQCKSHEECSSTSVHGVPRDASKSVDAGSAFGRESREQSSREPCLGNPGGQLEGQGGSWARHERGEASSIQAGRRCEKPHSLGGCERTVQSAACGQSIGHVSISNLRDLPWVIGSRLWVREAWRLYDSSEECACYDSCRCSAYSGQPLYRADWAGEASEYKWRPSIHMPRRLCRIVLEVKSVRVERLQEITEAEAVAEGFERDFRSDGTDYGCGLVSAVEGFAALWDQLNADRGYSWESNPWVWRVEFKRIQGD